MADYSLKVDFFNTFILRFEDKNELFVEESRIKGGFNEPFVSNGPKAHLVDVISKCFNIFWYIQFKN